MRLEFLKENFRNQNYWIVHANSIASILFTFNGIFLFWVTKEIIISRENPSCIQLSLIGAFIATSILSFFALVSVIFPRLGTKTNSLLYFGGISNQKKEEFKERMKNIDNSQILEEFADQIYQNAKIATKKFVYIREAIILTLLNLLIAVILMIF